MQRIPTMALGLALWGLLFSVAPHVRAAEWVAIAVSGEPVKVVSPDRVEELGEMVTLRDAGGRALGAWQKSFVLERMVQPPAEKSSWEAGALRARLGEWEAFLGRHAVAEPLVGPVLKEVRAFVKFQDEQAAAALAEKQKRLQGRLEAVLAMPLPPKDPTPDAEMIQAHIRDARALLAEMPEASAKLQEHLKPWEEIGDALAAGKVWFEDAWKTPQEIDALKQERLRKIREAAMEKVGRMEIPATVIPADKMGQLQIGVLVSFGLGVLALPALLIWRTTTSTVIKSKSQGHVRLTHKSGLLESIKILLFLTSFVVVAVEGYYIYRLWFAPRGAEVQLAEPAACPDLLKMAYACSRPSDLKMVDVPREVKVANAALNSHLAQYLAFTGGGQEGALERTAWSVRIDPQAILIQENLRCGSRTWTATYTIELSEDAGGKRFRTGRVLIDGMQVPQILGGLLWNSFQAELQSWAKRSAVSQHYQFAGVEEDKLLLRISMMPPLQP
ncbi:MAG: hypothetical protein SFU85_05860 [Candidatus Methylacidiphilales bacterium]|nr:hypothetical protein [Candidatus Methylacidiphilales bacterium]